MLEISASRISNVVTFTTDFNSLQKAKNEVDKLQKKMQGIKPVQVAAARQKDLQRLGKEIQRQHDQHSDSDQPAFRSRFHRFPSASPLSGFPTIYFAAARGDSCPNFPHNPP